MTSHCNLRCVFCSRPHNPGHVLVFDMPDRSADEIERDLSVASGTGRVVIGESATRINEGEPCLHPRWRDVVWMLATRPTRPEISLTTNATLLTSADAELLASAGVRVTVSLNAVDPTARRTLLGDPEPRRAPRAVCELAEAGAMLDGSLVAMPGLVGWDELSATVRWLDDAGARTIRVFIPGMTQWSDPVVRSWVGNREDVERWCDGLRPDIRAAIVVEPPTLDDPWARVEDVTTGSSADRLGLKSGDVIVGIGSRTVSGRTEAARLLRAGVRSVRIRRGQDELLLVGDGEPVAGAVLFRDLPRRTVNRLRRAIEEVRQPLVLCSAPAEGLLRSLLRETRAHVMPVRSMVYGGTIDCAGLLTTRDMVHALGKRTGHDRVIVPAVMFGDDGVDLLGGTVDDLARGVGARVTVV